MVTSNKMLPNIENIIGILLLMLLAHWHILSIYEKFKKAFNKIPFIANRKIKSLHQIIGGNHILQSKVGHKKMKTTNNQENVHCASHNFAVKK